MANYAGVVNGIRSVLAGANQTKDEKLDFLAEEYNKICQTLCRRLERCQDLLNRGRRSEALHYAQTPPDLLDSLAVIDMPELPQWDQLLAMYGLAPIPAINRATAAALNEAFAVQAPLDTNLKALRRMALERAPLGKRVAVLRNLLELDPQNPIWAENLGEVEKDRLEQMQTEARQAIKARDLEALRRLQMELHAPWFGCQPDASLVSRVERGVYALEGAQRFRQLEWLTQEVVKAYTVRDLPLLQSKLASWQALANTLALSETDPVYALVRPAMDWIKRLQRIAENKRAAKRERTRWVWSIGFMVVVCIGALIFIRMRQREAAYLEDVNTITAYLDDGNIENAERLFAQIRRLRPAELERSDMVDLDDRMLALKQKEVVRIDAFERALQHVRNAPVADERPDALVDVQKFLKKPEEKQQLANVMKDRDAKRNELQDVRDRELREVTAKLDRIVAKEAGIDLEPQIDDVIARLRKLDAEPILKKRALEFRDLIKQESAKGQALERMKASFTGEFDLDSFLSRLKDYTAPVGSSRDAERRNKAILLAQPTREVIDWNSALPEIKKDFWPPEQDPRQAFIKRFLNERQPASAVIERYSKALQGSRSQARADLRSYLSEPLISKLYSVQSFTDKRVYTTDERYVESDKQARLASEPDFYARIVLGYNKKDQRLERVRAGTLALARSAALVKDFLTVSKDKMMTDYDERLIAMTRRVLREPEIDPVLKLILLKKLIKFAGEGDAILGESLSKHKQYLDNAGLDVSVPWMNPDNADAKAARLEAANVFKGLPSLDNILKVVREQKAIVEKELLATGMRPVGFLYKDKRKEWQVGTNGVEQLPAEVFVLVSDGPAVGWGKIDLFPLERRVVTLPVESVDVGMVVFAKTR